MEDEASKALVDKDWLRPLFLPLRGNPVAAEESAASAVMANVVKSLAGNAAQERKES